ncbi:hypothetical protein MKW94_010804 [Papaver nudicaule]|uniref:Uncharacterized protein n=1 Tax=Papaver nudicaule TaxID=74823 RepID=A0AA42AZ79_PAPNU|nr:hypothetical protein [Papaver nudicaule]
MNFEIKNWINVTICFVSFLLAIPILAIGVWLGVRATSTECVVSFLEIPVITSGVFLVLLSLFGLFGSHYGKTWMVYVYGIGVFILFLFLVAFTIFSFIVTRDGSRGQAIGARGYREYVLDDYSNWLQTQVKSDRNWKRIQKCLFKRNVCRSLSEKHHLEIKQFFGLHLTHIESGCCKPPQDCGFIYIEPTVWEKRIDQNSTISSNPDCQIWGTSPGLCFNCESCRAAVLVNVKRDWRVVSIICNVCIVAIVVFLPVNYIFFRCWFETS